MIKKLFLICLALMLSWTFAAADALSLKGSLSVGDLTLEADLLAAQYPDGSMLGSVTVDGEQFAVAMDPALGLLLQDSDGAWHQITAFGAPLTLLTLSTLAADRSDADDFGDCVLRDLDTIGSRLRIASERAGVNDRFIGLWLTLSQSGSVTITGEDLSGFMTETAGVWLDALFTGATVTSDGHDITITLPGEVPESLTSLEMGEMYADLWHRLVPADGLTLILPDVPDFALTIALADSSVTVSLSCDAITLDMTLAIDLSVLGLRFSGSGSTKNGSFSFSGAAGLNGLNCNVTTETAAFEARISFGPYASAFAQYTVTGQTDPAFTLYASFSPSSCTLNATTPLYTITATAVDGVLDAIIRDRGASVLATPLVRLNVRQLASGFSLSLTTPDISDTLNASWQQYSGTVTLSRYNYHTAQSVTGLLTWATLNGQFTLTGSLTLPDRPTMTSTLTLSTDPFTGGELMISSGGDVRRYAVTCQQPAPGSLQLLLRDSCTGSRNYSRSITAVWTTKPDNSRLDLSWDNSASGRPPLTAVMIFSPGDGDHTAISIEAFSGDATVFEGSADLTVDGSRKVFSGAISLPDASPLSVWLEIDTDPTVPDATWPQTPARFDLFR